MNIRSVICQFSALLFPVLASAADLSYFVEFDHDSMLNEVHDYGHQTIGVGVEYTSGPWAVSGKVARPIFTQEPHRDEKDDWRDEDILGGFTLRYYLGGRK